MMNIELAQQRGIALFAILMMVDGHDPWGRDPAQDEGVCEADWEWVYVVEAEALIKSHPSESFATLVRMARPGQV